MNQEAALRSGRRLRRRDGLTGGATSEARLEVHRRWPPICGSLVLAMGVGLLGCLEPSGLAPTGDVRIRVVDSAGGPISGVAVWGGIDWRAWRTRTDSAGFATITNVAPGASARLAATSFIPRAIALSEDADYELEQTPLRLEVLGMAPGLPTDLVRVVPILGDAIRVRADTVTTLFNASVRTYTYGVDGAEFLREYGLVNPGRGFAMFGAVEGEELWVLVVMYGPSPRKTFIRSYTPAFAPDRLLVDRAVSTGRWITKSDSLLVVGGEYRDSTRVFVVAADSLRQVGAIAHPAAASRSGAYSGFFMGDALVFAGASDLTLIDVTDPTDPRVRDVRSWPVPRQFIPFGDSMLVGPPARSPGAGVSSVSYQVLDFATPFEPVEAGRVDSDAYVEEVRADGWAFGAWTGDGWTASILQLEGPRYRLQATVTLGPARFGGPHLIVPPYFVADGLVLGTTRGR
jgi:hypothetical protein